MIHTELNKLIKKNELKAYLEIGSQTGTTYEKIKCKNKTSVDVVGEPDFKGTSDKFFAQNDRKFDCIFIDGDHLARQVEKDVINAFACLKQGGFIVMHDIRPKTEGMASDPRKQKEWCGTVYKVWAGILKNTKLKTFELKDEYGLGVIEKKGMAKPKEGMTESNLTFEDYEKDF